MSSKKQTEAPEVDLFGAPVGQIRERWGRPSYKKTKENQLLVATLKAAGWSNIRIARYLNCNVDTLTKHFSDELRAGTDLIEGQALEVLISKMRVGNMPAVRQVLDLVRDGKAIPPQPQPDPEPAAKPLGKKAAQAEAARNPGPGWGPILN